LENIRKVVRESAMAVIDVAPEFCSIITATFVSLKDEDEVPSATVVLDTPIGAFTVKITHEDDEDTERAKALATLTGEER
jgi:hypothetical protein